MAKNRRSQWILEDFLDSPVLALYPGANSKSLTAAETPSSVFAMLPYALQHGYLYLTVAHEQSADTGQVIWDKTGEDVNHQWGKSTEAEELINSYIQMNLVSNVAYFSILKPIYDVLIFNLLRRDLDGLFDAHSCNITKPWCKRCPKCAYVWLQYMAWLPVEYVDEIFSETNLFDLPENQATYLDLLGVTESMPFECVGQADEVKLAFEICRRKGLKGKAMELYVALNIDIDIEAMISKYLFVGSPNSNFPPHIWEMVETQFRAAINETQEYITQYFDD